MYPCPIGPAEAGAIAEALMTETSNERATRTRIFGFCGMAATRPLGRAVPWTDLHPDASKSSNARIVPSRNESYPPAAPSTRKLGYLAVDVIRSAPPGGPHLHDQDPKGKCELAIQAIQARSGLPSSLDSGPRKNSFVDSRWSTTASDPASRRDQRR